MASAHSALTFGLIVLAGSAALLGAEQRAAAETIDRVAAIVDDDIITFQDLRVEGRIRLASTGMSIDTLDSAPNRREQLEMLLTRMVQTRLLVQEADKLQVPVGAAEVDERLQMIYDRFGTSEEQYRELMRQAGIPWEAFRKFLRDELKSQFVIRTELGGQVSVSPADVEACARERMPSGKTVAKLELSQILVAADPQSETLGTTSAVGSLYPAWWNGADAARFVAALVLYRMVTAEGQPFGEVASAFSSGRSRDKAGKLGTFARGDLAPEFDPVFDLQPGQVSDIIETTAGFHILRVDAREDVDNDKWQKTLDACNGELLQDESTKLIDGWISNLSAKRFVKVKLLDNIASN